MFGTEQEDNGLTDESELNALFATAFGSAVKREEVEIKPEETPVETTDQAPVAVEDNTAEVTQTTTEDQDDPLKDLPESVREFIKKKEQEAEEARRKEAEWRQKFKSDEGRQAALQRKTQELERMLREKSSTAQTAPTKLKTEESEEWKVLSENDPAMARLLKNLYEDATRQAEERAQAAIKPLVEPIERFQQESVQEREYHRLLQMVPDLNQITHDPNYGEWFYKQPESIQRMAGGGSAEDQAYVIQLFSLARPDLFAPPQQNQEQAKTEAMKTQSTQSVTSAPNVEKLAQDRAKKVQNQGVISKVVATPTEPSEDDLFKNAFKSALYPKR